MPELQLTDNAANALGGTVDPDTGAPYPGIAETSYHTKVYKQLAQIVAAYKLANNMRVFEVDGNADAIGVRSGRCVINGTARAYTEQDPAVDGLTDNDTTYIWAEDGGAGLAQINSAIDGTGWPSTEHIPLAEVTMSSGTIDSIVDRRFDQVLKSIWRANSRQEALVRYQQSLAGMRNGDGTVMDETGGTGKWKIVAGGWGSGTLTLETEAVQNTTDNADLSREFVLPAEYDPGQDIKVVVNAKFVNSGGTTLTHTIDVEVYKLGDDGTVGSDLNTVSAQTLTASAADYTFTITPTGLVAGDRLRLLVRGTVTEAGNTGTLKAVIGSAEFQLDIKG